MCNACGFPAAPGHWTEAGATKPGDKLRARFIRVATLQRILKQYGISAFDDGNIPKIQLRASDGTGILVSDLSELWVEVERVIGHPIDPFSDSAH